ncbi:MAG: sigma 54-interacting transcriptional regulator [Candidatus Acidiferrales bacterium]
MLLEINNAIVTHLTREKLLHAVSEILRRVLPFDGAVITIYNPKTDTFRYFAMETDISSDHFRAGVEFQRKDSVSAWVFDQQRAVVRGDLEKEQQYPNDRLVLAEGICSDCIVPLIVGGKSIGTLNVGSKTKNQYTSANMEILQEVANQVALAVSNMNAYEEIAALNSRVERTAARYRTLLEVNNAIITHLTQEDLLHSISAILRGCLPLDGAVIALYIPETETFRYFALETTLSTDYFRPGLEVARKESTVAEIFDNQRGRIRHDLEKEQKVAHDRRLIEIGIASDCIVPMVVGGKSIGTLGVGSTKKNQYSESDMELLQEVANQVALAIANMSSYGEIAALNVKVERTAARYRTLLEINNAIITNLTQPALLHAISETLNPVIAFDRCAITLYQPANDSFRFLAVEGDLHSDYFRAGLEDARDETCIAWVFDHQRPLLRRNLEKEREYANEHRLASEGIQSLCVLPLAFQGNCIGTLSLVSRERDRYSNEDVEFSQEVANQVALAVANMRSYQEINELKARLEKENVYLQEEIRTDHNFEEITGNSAALLTVLRKVEQVAPTDSTVLIHGETGTGKELIARAIHDRSVRKSRPLVKVNCSAISAGLVESELFGHVKGAFTGALERHVGRFELADGGTIFLDEIGELPLATQVKLLRVLQEREFEAVGSNRPVRVDVRVIAATNRNLQESIRTGDFRSDLFYRLNVFPIDVPPLRERRSDIPQLAMYFLARFAKKFGKDIRSIPRATLDRLSSYSWPGNIRELQNVIERAAILSRTSVLELDPDLIPELALSHSSAIPEKSSEALQPASPVPSTPPTLEELDRAHIIAVLNQTRGVVEGPRGAAKILGLHPNTLRHRIQKLGLKRTSYHPS